MRDLPLHERCRRVALRLQTVPYMLVREEVQLYEPRLARRVGAPEGSAEG